jgi:hypothetical protein
MTRTIDIKHPSQMMLQVFDSLREKKLRQADMLADKEECLFTIKM